MKNYPTGQIRNIVILGHGSAGKTSLAEAMMFQTGAIQKMGNIDQGSTVADVDIDEIQRKHTISTALLPVQYEDVKINVLDAPGYADFIGEVTSAIYVADAAVMVVDGTAGVQVQTDRYWRMVREQQMPGLFFVTKMDKEGADFDKALLALKKRFGSGVVPIQYPIGKESGFNGVIDLVHMKALVGDESTVRPKISEIPAEYAEVAEKLREQVIEAAAEASDDLTLKFLEEGTLSDEEIINGLQIVIREGKAFPVLMGAGTKNLGTIPLLKTIIECLPSPSERPAVIARQNDADIELTALDNGPLAAYVFKTSIDQFAGKVNFLRIFSGSLHGGMELFNTTKETKERIGNLFELVNKQQDVVERASAGDIVEVAKLHDTGTTHTLSTNGARILITPVKYPEPMLNFSLSPVTKGDEDKMAQGLHRFMEEDMTLRFEQDAETHQSIIAGMGELQIEVTRERLKRKFNVATVLHNPQVAYRETIRVKAEGHGRHKKQSGGAGLFGEVMIRLEPMPRGTGYVFEDAVVGASVPNNFIPKVDMGVREAMKHGPIAGFPVIDFKCVLYDGKSHPVDSKEIAFITAGRLGFHDAMEKAQPVLLEPYVNAEITIPDELIGDVFSGVSGKRGRVQGSDSLGGGMAVVRVTVPQAEMFQYSNELRALSQGRGSFTMSFSHYEDAPMQITEKVKAEAVKRHSEEH